MTYDLRCGTEAGEIAHRRRGEKPCASCRAEKNRKRAERRVRKGVWGEHWYTPHCPSCGRFCNPDEPCRGCGYQPKEYFNAGVAQLSI